MPPPVPPSAPPQLPLLVIRALVPSADRDEIIADLTREYGERVANGGVSNARRWLRGQALASIPALLHWTWWRGATGYEPPSSAFRPRRPIVRTLIADARYALRRLGTRPAYTTLAVLTLALGIGGTTAIFGVARPVILDPLPYANARTTASFWMPGWWTEEEFLYLRGKIPGFTAVGAYRPGEVTLRDGDAPSRLIPAVQVTSELFDVLGARPMLGRPFRSGDDVRGSESAVMISYGLWQELGGTNAIVGKRFMLNGAPRTVIGVMPKGFWFPSPDIRVWHTEPLDPEGRNGSYTLVGLAAPGIDVTQMTAPLAQLTKMIGARFQYAPKADKTRDASVQPLRDALLGSMRPAIIATLVGMGLILLIACTNVSALMLGQVEGRATELAVRSALGATRARIVQQLVIEALAVGAMAGIVGGVLAAVGFGTLARALPLGAWSDSASFDWTLFIAALGVAIAAVLIVVLVPIASLRRADLRDTLSRARTAGVNGRGPRLEHALIVIEVALAMLIATSAGLLVRSVAHRYAIDPGIETRNIALIDVSAGPELKSAERARVIDDVLRALAALPGVRSAGAAMKIPLRGGGDSFGISVDGQESEEHAFTYFRIGSLDYFTTMGYRLRAGRLFNTGDRPDTSEVPILINEALARKYFPGVNPLGRVMGGGFGVKQRIVGIVADASEAELKTEGEPTRYYLEHLVPWFSRGATFVLRTNGSGDPAALLDEARRAVQRAAPGFGIQGTTTMSRVFDEAVGPARQVMSLLALLAGLALLLGAIGIYGVISHFASRRTRDWAIRVALGLPGSGVIVHIVRQGVGLALAGVLVGFAGAVSLTRLLETFLFGVKAIDPLSFALSSGVLLLVGAIAAFIPARRAGSVDPALVLREQ